MAGEIANAGEPEAVRSAAKRFARVSATQINALLSMAQTSIPEGTSGALSTSRLAGSLEAPLNAVRAVTAADDQIQTLLNDHAAVIADIKSETTRHLNITRFERSQGTDARAELAAQPDSPAAQRKLERSQRILADSDRALTELDQARTRSDSILASQLYNLAAHYRNLGARLPAPPRVSANLRVSVSIDGVVREVSVIDIALLQDPARIAEVWASLTPEQRDVLIQDNPLLVGNLEGIPLRDRDAANRITATEYRARIERELFFAEYVAGLPQDPLTHLMDHDADIARLRGEIRTIDQMLGDRNHLYAGQGNPVGYPFGEYEVLDENREPYKRNGVVLVGFDPTRDSIITFQGALDPVTGNVAPWVSRVGTFIPGSNSHIGGFEGDVHRSRTMLQAAEPGVGMFTWHGAAMPDIDQNTILEAGKRTFAEVGAPRLAVFLNSVSLPEGTSMVPVGHSYGAVVLARAEQLGLKADRVVYVAPAGLGHDTVNGVSDFPNTGDVNHFVLQARNDVVVGISQKGMSSDALDLGHGKLDPVRAPGVVRLETGFRVWNKPESGTIESRGRTGSHSAVLDEESTSIFNIAGVISGEPVSRYQPDDQESINTLRSGRLTFDIEGTGVLKPQRWISPIDLSESSGR
ncbi:alpha/beta hydrolase [Mycetocola tolaasinivorans]|nr:alpha/beta hydrolase [Mycetocola tolaasinivorans]